MGKWTIKSLSYLSVLTGSMSVISMITHYTDAGLHYIFKDFIDYYRAVVTFAFGWIHNPFNGWRINQLQLDVSALNFVLFSALVRAFKVSFIEDIDRTFKNTVFYDFLPIILVALVSVVLAVFAPFSLSITFGFVVTALGLDDRGYDDKIGNANRKQVFQIIFAMILFFSFNAFALSVA